MFDELAIWLVPILVGIFIVQNWAYQLVALFATYFIVVRLLEKVTIGGLRTKPVLITGCDSGFGRDLTLKCVKEGMPVFAACFTEQGQKELAQEAAKFPGGEDLLETFNLDVRNEESVKQGREFVESKLKQFNAKGLWGLVNNAGIGDMRGWDDWQTPAIYERFWQVNTLGVIRATHAFKPLIKRVKGRIVNVSSICGKVPMPTLGPYSVSKYAVAAYNDVLRAEMAQFGVKVSCLEPGFFKTPQANPAVSMADAKGVWDRAPEDVKEEYGEEYFKWSQKLIADYLDYKCKPNTEWVVDAYYNALTSAYPRARYQVGYDSTFQFTPLSYLPTRWQDWLFRAYFTYVAGQPRTKVVY